MSDKEAAPAPARFLRAAEAAQYLSIAKSTLDKMRLSGNGPPFYKIGPRVVAYAKRDLDGWMATRLRSSTSDKGMRVVDRSWC